MACSNGVFRLESPAFADGGLIPAMYTGEALNLSPPLHWHGAPAGTRSYALVMDDPDAPAGPWVHWLLFNIPAQLERLPAGLDRAPELPNGARQGCCWGVDSFDRLGYQGPLPPAGRAHRYRFRLHALDGLLELAPGCTLFALREAMADHHLGQAELMGVFGCGAALRRDVQHNAAN
ncbi:MAG: YbhB/YbcL family Raf kinase inhibitor-like protein [Cyanobium sp.]